MNNICTTVEQSKRLLELGLNPLTSDMYWGLKGSLMHPSDEYELNIGRDPAIEHNLFSYREGYTIPAWSLGALLELMPHTGFDGIELNNYSDAKTAWTAIFHWKAENTPIRIAKTPLDAVYEIIIWLLENNYIKKEKI